MKISANSATGPSLEMLRMSAKGMRRMSWSAMRTGVESGVVSFGVTASRKENMFSAVKIIPAHTKPICEMVIEAKIKDRIFGPTISAPRSP